MNDHVIIAPHADDEIIGTFEILNNPKLKPIIIYTSDMNDERKKECMKLKEEVDIKAQFFLNNIPSNFLNPISNNTFYFPHPIYETHPDHRVQGIVGESMARNGYNVIFYITEMNAPFKYECPFPKAKLELLNIIYPSQKDLWKYDHKYFLFSGYDQWKFFMMRGECI